MIPRESLIPAKFLIPGTVFLIGFTLIPIIYTINIAFTNYSTGHILSKSEAIEQINLRSLSQPTNGTTYTLSPAHSADGKLVLLLVDDKTKTPYVGTPAGLEQLAASGRDDPAGRDHGGGRLQAAPGRRALLARPRARQLSRSAPRRLRHPSGGRRLRGAAQAGQEVRRADRHVHEHVRSGGLPRQRIRLLRDRPTARRSSPAGRPTTASSSSRRSSPTRSTAARSCASSSGRSSSPRRPCSSRSRSASSSRSRCRRSSSDSASTARCSSSRSRCRPSSRSSSGADC